MTPESADVLETAREVLAVTADGADPGVTERLRAAIRDLETSPDAVVQLYSVSQAGKSTLMSMLTGGQQFVPIGQGTATTAVVIELIGVDAAEEERAEVQWLAPGDLLSLVAECLEPFLGSDADDEPQPATGSVGVSVQGGPRSLFRLTPPRRDLDVGTLPPTALADDAVRDAFLDAVRRAHKLRSVEAGSVGNRDDLRVAEAILRFYRSYQQATKQLPPGAFVPVPVGDLHQWTRQPYGWGTRNFGTLTFDELRCFFVRRVRLYARTAPFLRGVRVLDAPGFGVSRVHDRISRSAQESADAVLLLLGASGSEITNTQLQEVRQLAIGDRGNLFVLWNPKSGRQTDARRLLANDLVRLRDGAHVDVPAERSTVANLLLGLRALQWRMLAGDPEPLSRETTRALAEAARFAYPDRPIPPEDRGAAEYLLRRDVKTAFGAYVGPIDDELGEASTLDDVARAGLDASGWADDIPALFATIRARHRNRRTQECVARAADAIGFHLARFPAEQEADALRRKIDASLAVIREFESRTPGDGQRLREAMRPKLGEVLEELPASLLNTSAVANLRSGVQHVIEEEVQTSVVHTKLRARLKDHLETRCGLWCRSVVELTSPASQLAVRFEYGVAVGDLRDWTVGRMRVVIDDFDLPNAAPPTADFTAFREEFNAAFDAFVDAFLTPDSLTRFLTWVTETGRAVVDAGRRTFRQIRGWLTKLPDGAVVERPRFDRVEAARQVDRDLRRFLEPDGIRYLLSVDPRVHAQLTVREFIEALGTAAQRRPASLDQAVAQAFTIVAERREQLRASGDGVILHAAAAVVRAVDDAFAGWTQAVRGTLADVHAQLVAQRERRPTPVGEDVLATLSRCAAALRASVSPHDVDAFGRVAQAVQAVAAHRARAQPA